MADAKISALTDGGGLAAGDAIAIARSGASYRASPIGHPVLVYRYEVTGSDKASIDTGVDTPDAGSNDWTNGDILEVYFYSRTDDSPGFTNVNVTVNNDGSSIYDEQIIRADNATVSGGSVRAAALWVFATAGASMGSGVFGTLDMRFQNYAGTVGNKHGVVVFGIADSTAATCAAREYALGYRSTSAMTRLKLAADSTKKFKVGTQLLIYKRLAS